MNRIKLNPDRLNFTLDDNPWTWRGTLTWSLFGKAVNMGIEAARPVVVDRRSVGANTICCSSMLSWGHPVNPSSPNYWETLTPFVHMLRDEGMRLCLIVFADTKSLMPDEGSQKAHWERMYTHLGAEDNVTFLLANQPWHPSQSINVYNFDKPKSIAGFPAQLAMRDNPNEDVPPTLPPWDFSAFCSKRNEPFWFMEAGCVSMWTIVNDHTHSATILFEPPPCGRRAEWTDPGKWRQFGRSICMRGSAGANFYSDHDARSDVYTGITRDCAVEFLGNLPNP